MYEVIAILNPNVTSEFVETKIGDWTNIVQEYKAELHRVDRWGKKNLAYEVKKFKQGYFLLFHISGQHDIIDELERRFRISDDVLRYQTVKLNDLEYQTSVELLDQMSARNSDDREIIEEDKKSEDTNSDSPKEDKEDKEDKVVEEVKTTEPAVESEPEVKEQETEETEEKTDAE